MLDTITCVDIQDDITYTEKEAFSLSLQSIAPSALVHFWDDHEEKNVHKLSSYVWPLADFVHPYCPDQDFRKLFNEPLDHVVYPDFDMFSHNIFDTDGVMNPISNSFVRPDREMLLRSGCNGT